MYTRTEHPLHIIQEVLDNAADEALAGFGKHIQVTLHTDGSVTPLDSSSPELLRARTTVPLGQGFKRFAPCMASFAVAAQASVFRRLRAVIGARNDPRLVKPKACSAAAKSCPRNHFQKATTVSGYPRGGFFMPFLRDLPGLTGADATSAD
jgi:hypothetical protein